MPIAVVSTHRCVAAVEVVEHHIVFAAVVNNLLAVVVVAAASYTLVPVNVKSNENTLNWDAEVLENDSSLGDIGALECACDEEVEEMDRADVDVVENVDRAAVETGTETGDIALTEAAEGGNHEGYADVFEPEFVQGIGLRDEVGFGNERDTRST